MLKRKTSVCAMVALFLVFCPLSAYATSFNFWDIFPDSQGQNGINAYSDPYPYTTPIELIHVNPLGSFAFSSDGTAGTAPLLQRSTQSYILFQPTTTDQVIMTYLPSQPSTIDFECDFLASGGGSVIVNWGLFSGDSGVSMGEATISSNDTAHFSMSGVNLSPDSGIFFAVDGSDGGNSATLFSGTIDVYPAPLPPTAWLFGSGLLGLAGWRRFRKG